MSQPPPVMVYTNTITAQPQPPSRHSDGSFGTVFIVLAVIVVVSGVACFLGRLCNRKLQGPKSNAKVKQSQGGSRHHQGPRPRDREPPEFSLRHKPKDPEFNFRPKQRDPEFDFQPKERDLELGFGKGGMPPAGKPGGENRGTRSSSKNGDFSVDPKHGFYSGDPRSKA